jgi:methionyl-tRNA synthetase
VSPPPFPRPATPKPALSEAEGFSWEDFVERNKHVLSVAEGNELVATWGNLCQRPRRALGFMLSFATKRFHGVVPEPGELDDEDRALLEKVEADSRQ